MKKGLWHIRIPTFSAFAVLFISIFVTSYILQKGSNFIGQASPDRTPQNVVISNISDSSFTVSFVTYDKTVSAVSLAVDQATTQTHFDIRNGNTREDAFYSHFITVSGLAPERRYEFSILSGGEIYLDSGKKYTITTASKVSSQTNSASSLVAGRVLLPDGTSGSDVIVLVEIPGAQTLSQVTKSDGTYKFNIGLIRNTNLNSYIKIDPKSIIQLRFMRQNLESTIKSVFLESSAIPRVTLSYKYDFSNIETVEPESLTSELKISIAGDPTGEVKIINPKSGQSFIDDRPLFQGTTGPKQKVNITIESDPIKSSVIADEKGLWSFRPSVSLEPGTHKITIQSIDAFGIIKTVTSSFTVYAQGSQIAQSGPTVTPTPKTTATPTPTPTRTSASPTPTKSPSLTPSPTTAAVTTSPTTPPTVPPTKTPTPTVVLPTATPTTIPTATKAPTPTSRTATTTPAPPGGPAGTAVAILSVVLIVTGGMFLLLL